LNGNEENKKLLDIIRLISKGSCNTEDCSNDAENSALITGIIILHFKIYSNRKQFY